MEPRRTPTDAPAPFSHRALRPSETSALLEAEQSDNDASLMNIDIRDDRPAVRC
jgi:hypothetical protein